MRIAVIGGGMAGLSAAHEILRRGGEPLVFESEARPGGKVGTRSEQGYLTEDGPNFLARALDPLLDTAGLREEVVKPAPPMTRWVHLDGRAATSKAIALMRGAVLHGTCATMRVAPAEPTGAATPLISTSIAGSPSASGQGVPAAFTPAGGPRLKPFIQIMIGLLVIE